MRTRYTHTATFEDVTVWEARRALDRALADSVQVEAGDESEAFRVAKIASLDPWAYGLHLNARGEARDR